MRSGTLQRSMTVRSDGFPQRGPRSLMAKILYQRLTALQPVNAREQIKAYLMYSFTYLAALRWPEV